MAVIPWDLATKDRGKEKPLRAEAELGESHYQLCSWFYCSETSEEILLISLNAYFKTFYIVLEFNPSIGKWITTKRFCSVKTELSLFPLMTLHALPRWAKRRGVWVLLGHGYRDPSHFVSLGGTYDMVLFCKVLEAQRCYKPKMLLSFYMFYLFFINLYVYMGTCATAHMCRSEYNSLIPCGPQGLNSGLAVSTFTQWVLSLPPKTHLIWSRNLHEEDRGDEPSGNQNTSL